MALGINKKRGGSKLKVLVPLLVDQAPLVRGTIATAHNSASVGLKPYVWKPSTVGTWDDRQISANGT